MDSRFKDLVDGLGMKFQQLVGMEPVRISSLPKVMPERGIYLFSEGDMHLYVGRTNRLRRRLRDHARSGSGHNMATFAFRVARHETGLVKATYTSRGSRKALELDDAFGPVFIAAKLRLSSMEIRFVEEQDPLRQALLEMYTAVVLRTPFNDFENH